MTTKMNPLVTVSSKSTIQQIARSLCSAPVQPASGIARVREVFPRLRRSASTAIVHSGGKQTIFGCLCGSSHTTSTDWNGRAAKHVREWERDHASCALRVAERLSAGLPAKLVRVGAAGRTMPAVQFVAS